jgi:transcriptional regulator with XRE-family HTH domain
MAVTKPKPNLFGVLVRKSREREGLTLAQVAGKLNTHKGYISGIEWGKVNPPAAKLAARYARLFGWDPVDLVELSEAVKAPKLLRPRAYSHMLDNKLFALAMSFCSLEELCEMHVDLPLLVSPSAAPVGIPAVPVV